MNKQAAIFGLGGMLLAGVVALMISIPRSESSSVLSDTSEQSPATDTSGRDTIDILEQAQEEDEAMAENTAPDMQIDTSKTYSAVLKTSEGDITVQLYDDATPITVNNFVSLARDGFYDGTIFHRVIDGFMIQGGDPQGDGTGGPGYRFDDEPFEGDYDRGVLAMANAGPNTNGSQFFIMHQDYPLPPNYVIFGKVSSGLDVVDKIATAEVTASAGGEKSNPVSPVTVQSVSILEE